MFTKIMLQILNEKLFANCAGKEDCESNSKVHDLEEAGVRAALGTGYSYCSQLLFQ